MTTSLKKVRFGNESTCLKNRVTTHQNHIIRSQKQKKENLKIEENKIIKPQKEKQIKMKT